MRKRVRKAVEQAAIGLVVPCSTSIGNHQQQQHQQQSHHSLGKKMTASSGSVEKESGVASGLEPLMPEINHLAERLSKLVSIHMNVYGALYAQPGFLSD